MDQLNLTAVDLEAIIKPMVDAAVRRKCKFLPKIHFRTAIDIY